MIAKSSVTKSSVIGSQLTFVLLQLADVITTLFAIARGGAEGNPLVAHFMLIGTVQGLILSKIVVLAAATYAIRTRRFRVIRWSNIAFIAIVSWNVGIIVLLALRSHPK
jgi:Domain of unknown function (DUF5658)